MGSTNEIDVTFHISISFYSTSCFRMSVIKATENNSRWSHKNTSMSHFNPKSTGKKYLLFEPALIIGSRTTVYIIYILYIIYHIIFHNYCKKKWKGVLNLNVNIFFIQFWVKYTVDMFLSKSDSPSHIRMFLCFYLGHSFASLRRCREPYNGLCKPYKNVFKLCKEGRKCVLIIRTIIIN